MPVQLAIEGCPKAVRNQPAPWPQFDEKAIQAVEAVLRSGKVNYWTGTVSDMEQIAEGLVKVIEHYSK